MFCALKKSIGYELEVYLECGEEKDTSYVYLGCYDECGNTTSQTRKTTTTTRLMAKVNCKQSNGSTHRKTSHT